MNRKRGRFLTFEGGEGSGKSTQLRKLAETFRALGYDVATTREPGGTAAAEAIRHVLLKGGAQPFGPFAEATLFAAARADHVDTFISPHLANGVFVLCDRYIDSSRAYQVGVGSSLRHLERAAINGMVPDITLIFDLDPSVGLERVRVRDGGLDRFESSALSEQSERRQAFLTIAKNEPERCAVIDASGTPDDVHRRVERVIRKRLPDLFGAEPGSVT